MTDRLPDEQKEYVAIVGSREHADLEHVAAFMRALYKKQPDTIVVSGGADGVDMTAEQTWLSMGGNVVSLRVEYYAPERGYRIARWELGRQNSRKFVILEGPSFEDYKSGLLYRDLLVAEMCNRMVAFYRKGKSSGTRITVGFARDEQKDVYEYERD